jgi:hypothetical protein
LTKISARPRLGHKRMKTLGLFASAFLLSMASAWAQSQTPPAPKPPEPAPTLTATNRLQRIFGPTAVYDGVFPEVKRRGDVLNGLDLREPVVPGREFRNVSVNPHTGQAQGVLFMAIRF